MNEYNAHSPKRRLISEEGKTGLWELKNTRQRWELEATLKKHKWKFILIIWHTNLFQTLDFQNDGNQMYTLVFLLFRISLAQKEDQKVLTMEVTQTNISAKSPYSETHSQQIPRTSTELPISYSMPTLKYKQTVHGQTQKKFPRRREGGQNKQKTAIWKRKGWG